RDTYEIFRYLELNSQEVFSIALLNTKNEVIKVHDVFKGSINSSIVHPREIFREAIKERSSSMVVAHNHPSGDQRPSQEDLNVTDRLVEAGKVLGIQILDHVIIGKKNRYYSFAEHGNL